MENSTRTARRGFKLALSLGAAGAFAFVGIAKAFDSKRTTIDFLIGAIFTTVVWMIFALGLGVQLGPLVKGF